MLPKAPLYCPPVRYGCRKISKLLQRQGEWGCLRGLGLLAGQRDLTNHCPLLGVRLAAHLLLENLQGWVGQGLPERPKGSEGLLAG